MPGYRPSSPTHNAESVAAPAAPAGAVTGNAPGPHPAAAPAPAAEAGGVPVLSIVRGNPSAQEIAALVAVLFARRRPAGMPGSAPVRRFEWSSRSALMRVPVWGGPGGWRASALPR